MFMSQSGPSMSDRRRQSSPLEFSGHSTSSLSTSPSVQFFKSLSQCFEAGADLQNAVVDHDESVNVINASGRSSNASTLLQSQKGRQNHSTSSKDILTNQQMNCIPSTSYLNEENRDIQCIPVGKRPLVPTTPTSKFPSSPSNETEPTAPITTSSTSGKTTTFQQRLSLITGMSLSAQTPKQHSSPQSRPSTPETNIANTPCNTMKTHTLTGSTVANKTMDKFWNVHVTPADFTGLLRREEETDTFPRNSSSYLTTQSSPTATLSPLSHTAKTAAEVASAVFGMMESVGHHLGVHATKAERYCRERIPVVEFCGRENHLNCANRCLQKGMPEISEEPWEKVCGDSDKDCQEFDYFGFNVFREGEELEETSPMKNATRRNGEAITTMSIGNETAELTKGYEIRLKMTLSELDIKRKRQMIKNQSLCQEERITCTTENEDKNIGLFKNTRVDGGRTSPTLSELRRRAPLNIGITTTAAQNTHIQGKAKELTDNVPMEHFSIPSENIASDMIARTASGVSELTMHSHAERYHRYSCDSRRMAYYAVGRASSNGDAGSAGNRRCYFTGKEIHTNVPYYAGSVRQGPRTLVVFCLPEALGVRSVSETQRCVSKEDRDRHLQPLSDPDSELLEEMKKRYPDDFGTLPIQVQSPHCWKLYVKFCFFSGLPIAEGEMHYRVKSSITAFRGTKELPKSLSSSPTTSANELNTAIDTSQWNQEVALSHEIMEAVNGLESAEILRLPNQKTFDYLQRHYSQQSEKLNKAVFDRKCWEMVQPEV